MAIAATHRETIGTNTDASTYTTGSFTPTANTLQLLGVAPHRTGGTTVDPRVTGCGLTWVSVVAGGLSYNSGISKFFLFRALGASPTTGTLSIIYDTPSTESQSAHLHTWTEFSGTDTSGTNGSGAIVQSAVNQAMVIATLTATLAAFGDSDNAGYAMAGHDNSGSAMTLTANGYTELGAQATATAIAGRLGSMWRIGDADPVTSWTTNRDGAILAVEIKVATGVAVTDADYFTIVRPRFRVWA